MKRDELLVLARKCGFDITVNDGVPEDIVFIDWEHPEQTHVITSQALLFAKSVAAAEREACAKACEDQRDIRKEDRLCERAEKAHKWESDDSALRTSRELADVRLFHSGMSKAAAAIRARGQQ